MLSRTENYPTRHATLVLCIYPKNTGGRYVWVWHCVDCCDDPVCAVLFVVISPAFLFSNVDLSASHKFPQVSLRVSVRKLAINHSFISDLNNFYIVLEPRSVSLIHSMSCAKLATWCLLVSFSPILLTQITLNGKNLDRNASKSPSKCTFSIQIDFSVAFNIYTDLEFQVWILKVKQVKHFFSSEEMFDFSEMEFILRNAGTIVLTTLDVSRALMTF